MPGTGVWQRKTAPATPAAAKVRDSSEGGARRPVARERESPRGGNGTAQEQARDAPGTGPQRPGRGTARDHKRPGRGTRKAPRPVTLRWAVREISARTRTPR